MRPSLFVAAALLAACAPLPTGLAGAPASGPLETSAAVSAGDKAMYLTDSYNGSGLIPIDHLTLQDRSTKPQLPLYPSSGNNSWMVASLDGSTVAVMNYWYRDPVVPQGLEIGIYDGPNGLLRARFNPEVPVIVDGLSPDGSRIYARAWPPRESTAERLVLDARTGALLAREPRFSLNGDGLATVRDERTRRLYTLLAPTDPKATGPQPVELGGWDLRTGTELWRISVPSLSAGRWPTDRTIDGRAVYSSLTPGLAISPDGRLLAVVSAFASARAGTLWLIDAESGKLISQRAYGKTSFLERLFAPSIAAAKSWDESVIVSASFSPDGRVLHIRAQSTRVDVQGEPAQQYLGMVALALADASVLGSDIKMEPGWYDNRIHWVRPSSDGRWLYVFLERTGSFADPKGYVLRRLDPATLKMLAERRFDGWRQSFVLATR